MPTIEFVRFVLTGLRASLFSFASNVVATAVGLTFFASLQALTSGVGQFMERYHTRTVALTTLTVYQPTDRTESQAFDQHYRKQLAAIPGVRRVIYHELGFVEIGIAQGRMTTVCLRSAIADDPEIERLERVAGTNLPATSQPLQPPIVLPLSVAQRMSDLPAAELIGVDVALVVDRSLNLEDPNQQATLYGKITGIVNTVLASVERRTVEIGILRALGASTRQVIGIFLLEALVVALVGAAVTCAVLWIATDLINEWLLS